MKMKSSLMACAIVGFWSLAVLSEPTKERRAPSGLEIFDFKVCGKVFHLEVADQDSSRRKGLMNRSTLGVDEGMIFVFPDSKERSFWMKNVLIPLDILFFDSEGTFVSGEYMTPDSPLIQDMFKRRWSSLKPAQYVVEVRGKTFENLSNLEDFRNCRLEPVGNFPGFSGP